MKNSNGNVVKNQFIITDSSGDRYFQSYETLIAVYRNGNLILDSHAENYSNTTSRYLNQFTGQNKAQRMKNDSISYENLNS